MKKYFILGASLLALQAIPALAQDTPPGGPDGKKPPHEGMFEKQDANKDGKISEDEVVAGAKARFAEMDANKDGFVTKEEAKAHHDKMKEKWGEKRKEMKEKRGDKAKDVPPPADAPAQ